MPGVKEGGARLRVPPPPRWNGLHPGRRGFSLQAMEFETPLGWACIMGQGERLYRVCFGFETSGALRGRLRSSVPWAMVFTRWNLPLAERIQSFLQGTPDNFRDVPLGEIARTPFAVAVIDACRAIPPGSTLSYKELAARGGRPGAARAVGNVMAKNPVPIVVPCHRVVGRGGALGGYSAPGGIALKRWLLALEGAMAAPPRGDASTT